MLRRNSRVVLKVRDTIGTNGPPRSAVPHAANAWTLIAAIVQEDGYHSQDVR